MPFKNKKISAYDAMYEAQKIAYAPVIFQIVRALRDLGILKLLEDSHENGMTASAIGEELGISQYGVETLLESGLSCNVVEYDSGVYLAMHAAEQAVPVAEAWLNEGPLKYRKACKRFKREIKKGIANFSWFIYRFTTPVMKDLMSDPRNLLQVEQAVISMLAGDVFNNPNVARRLLVFKSIYAISWLLNWRSALAFRKQRIASVRAEYDQ